MGPLAIAHVAVLLVLTIWSVGLGVSVAFRPSQRNYELLRPTSWATAFASLSALLSGLCSVAIRLAAPPPSYTAASAWAGVAEALVPGMFGLGFLAVAWGLAAIGLRRLE